MNKLFFKISTILILSPINSTSAKIVSYSQNTGLISFNGRVIESINIIQDKEENCDNDLNKLNSYKILKIYKESFEYPTKKDADAFIDKIKDIIDTTPGLSIYKINDQAITFTITYE